MPRGIPNSGKAAKKGQPAPKKQQAKKISSAIPKLLKLSEVELLKIEKLTAQMRAVDHEMVITQTVKANYLAQVDPGGQIGRLDGKIQALKRERSEASDAYKEVAQSVNARLGIELKEYAYDDATGILRKIEDAPAEGAVASSAPTSAPT